MRPASYLNEGIIKFGWRRSYSWPLQRLFLLTESEAGEVMKVLCCWL